MKQGKKKRNLLIVFILLLALCFVTGCGLLRSDEDKLKDLLEDKYGEEFGVESYYYAGDMWAMCYPVSDPTLLFEVRTDGEVTKISHDYYLQNVVARQVEEEYGPLVEQVFPGSYLSVDISHTLSSIPETFPKADTVTLDDIIQYYSENDISSNIVFNIFIDTSQISNESVETEYFFLKDEIGESIICNELPDTLIKLYFGDFNFVHECESILSETTWMESDIYEETEGCPQIWIGYYDNGEIDYTLDVYVEKRTEALNNG
ncbi:MAG: hypothetical protein IJZ42_09325 [Lachnospiraceae bacterium]|nr:hypothetical protein [Lachnospiraceae bacterium]